ncbi:MAG: peptide chain release factor N(5)-glutamine methyltransferase [Solirubrobacterales bacterium]
MSLRTARDLLGEAAARLAATGVDSPRLDAELLLAEATGANRAEIAADPARPVGAPEAAAFERMLARRERREPVAYILGRRGFRMIELGVDRRVLVPRPETELLVEVAAELAPRTVFEVGTGSGAVALAVASELPETSVTATDTSSAALSVARANARRLGLEGRVAFLAGSLAAGHFDLVLANLPYVAERDRDSLPPEVALWEPAEALFAGPDGLEAIRGVVPRLLCETAALEVGAGQAGAVGELLRDAGFGSAEARRDLAGIERVVVARR